MINFIYRLLFNPLVLPGQTWKLDGVGIVDVVWTVNENHPTCVCYRKSITDEKCHIVDSMVFRASGRLLNK